MDLKVVVGVTDVWPFFIGWLSFCLLAAWGIHCGSRKTTTCVHCKEDVYE